MVVGEQIKFKMLIQKTLTSRQSLVAVKNYSWNFTQVAACCQPILHLNMYVCGGRGEEGLNWE